MAKSDGKVIIDVILDDGTVAKGVANIDKKLGGVTNAGKRAAAGIKEMVTALGLVALASRAIDAVKNSLDGAIARYDTLKSFPVVMEQMGFSAEQAQSSINKLSAGIDGLPTTLDSIVANTQRIALLTGDLDLATETALALNNAFLASGSSSADAERGLTQYVQMLSKGKVDVQSWTTLQETMGYALRETAAAFGFAGASAQNDLYAALQSGTITFDEFNAKLIELSNATGGFADIAKNSTSGIATSFSNMKAAVVKGVADVIGAIDKALGSFGGIAGIFDALKLHIKDAFSFITNLIPQIASVISTLYNAFMSVWNDTGEVDDLLGKLGISPEVAEIVESILKTITDSIKTAFDFIGTIISGLKQFWANNGQEILQNAIIIFQGVWGTVQTAFDGIKGVIENILGNNVIPFIQEKLSTIKQFWDENGQQIMQAVQNAFEFIKGVIEFVMPVVQFIIEIVWAAIKDIIGGALDIIMGLVQVFTGIFTGDWSQLWEGIKKILSGAVDLILGIMSLNFLGGIKKAFTSMFETGVNTVKNMWTSIVNFFKTFTDDAASKVSGMASKVWEFAKNMATNFINTVIRLKDDVVKKFQEIKDDIIEKVKSIDLKQIGKDIINGLISGIGSMASNVKQKVEEIASNLPKWMKKMLGIASPSKVMRDEIGRWIPAGIGVGIEKNEKSAIKSLQGLTDNLVSSIQPEIAVTNRMRGFKPSFGFSMIPFAGFEYTGEIAKSINPKEESQTGTVLEIYITSELDGKAVSKGIAEPLRIELDKINERENILKYGRKSK